jgi:hypothetical protein
MDKVVSNEVKRHPDVSEQLFAIRVRRGWPAAKAAETPPIRDKSPRIVVDLVPTTVTQARKRAGVSRNLYHSRLRIGWSKERAASTPPGRNSGAKTQAAYEYRGKKMPLSQWARHLNINYRTLLARINKGLSFEEAVEHPLGASLKKKR